MRKFLIIAAIALLGTLGLSACSNKGEQAESSAPTKVTRPTSADVAAAVKECQAKHPNAAPASTAASSASTSAPASAPASAATAAQGASDEDDQCARATIATGVWGPYLTQLVTANMGNIVNSPYVYFVPSSKYPENQGAISRLQGSLDSTIEATVLPGNMVAVAGPDSATTAQTIETAFKQAATGSFKGVVVLFIGDKADEAAVQQAVAPSGATFKFVQM